MLGILIHESGASIGALMYSERGPDGKLHNNCLIGSRDGSSVQEVLDALEGLARGVTLHYTRMKAAAARGASRIILPGGRPE